MRSAHQGLRVLGKIAPVAGSCISDIVVTPGASNPKKAGTTPRLLKMPESANTGALAVRYGT